MFTLSEEEFKKFHCSFFRNWKIDKDSKWFLKSINYLRNRWLLRHLTTMLKRLDGASVLDLCGGYGVMGAYLKAVKGLEFDYTCLENSTIRVEGGLKYFDALGLEGRFIKGDARKRLPLPENSFHVVWLLGWCDPYYDCDRLFSEVWRVLKPNGTFIFNMARKDHHLKTGQYKTYASRNELISLLHRQKFNVNSLHIISQADFGVVAKKRVND